jgi:hypothetical protein
MAMAFYVVSRIVRSSFTELLNEPRKISELMETACMLKELSSKHKGRGHQQ